jgi:hypothetical protein
MLFINSPAKFLFSSFFWCALLCISSIGQEIARFAFLNILQYRLPQPYNFAFLNALNLQPIM